MQPAIQATRAFLFKIVGQVPPSCLFMALKVFSAPQKEKRESCKMFLFFNLLKHEIKKKKKSGQLCTKGTTPSERFNDAFQVVVLRV